MDIDDLTTVYAKQMIDAAMKAEPDDRVQAIIPLLDEICEKHFIYGQKCLATGLRNELNRYIPTEPNP